MIIWSHDDSTFLHINQTHALQSPKANPYQDKTLNSSLFDNWGSWFPTVISFSQASVIASLFNHRGYCHLRMTSIASIARRAVTGVWSPALQLKWYCSHPPSISSPRGSLQLFVGGFSWSVDESTLLKAFSSFGEVTEVKIVYNKDTGRSRGFGFVNFSNGDDAKSAREAMDGKVVFGRPLRVSFGHRKDLGAPIVVPHIQDVEAISRRKSRLILRNMLPFPGVPKPLI
ncbi:small ribosomal subunit protein uS19m-like [Silene latifolia]|uniref:small ribosomal subunit protein uS19m-like n=1 Tax=Silene latifolia TaxID=37657 RepID=UPI003D77989B